MKEALIYTLKVWLSTLMIAPLLTVVLNWFIAWYSPLTYYSSSGFWVSVYIDVLAGLSLIPLSILFWLATLTLINSKAKVVVIKLLLTLAAIVLCIVPFVISGQNNQLSLDNIFSTSYWLPAYLFVAAISIWLYKLKFPNHQPTVVKV